MHDNILREITPLTQSDCFTYFYRAKSEFDFPLHYHDEIELNFIRNAKGAKRIIGDHVEEIGNLELALIGPGLPHGWFGAGFAPNQVEEVTIQFHKDFFDEKFLQKNQLNFIRNMLRRSLRGIIFSPETTARLEPRIVSLGKKQGFDSVLELMSILHDLSISRDYRVCSDSGFSDTEVFNYNSRRIEKVMEFIHSSFDKQITLGEAARIASMTESAFSRSRKRNFYLALIVTVASGSPSDEAVSFIVPFSFPAFTTTRHLPLNAFL